MNNPVVYFEIPVSNIDRAIQFYRSVFECDFTRETIDGNEMAFFPMSQHMPGITGALAKGEVYKPTRDGAILYFLVESIDKTLEKARQAGATVLYPKTSVGQNGFVAEFEDSEGNRIALSQRQ